MKTGVDVLREIPFSSPDITQIEFERVSEVISSGWFTHGKYTERFEELFCELTGARYAISVSNCTAGLHLSCMAAGFRRGDEVIVPAQTHTATAHAVELVGATAVFADVNPQTGNIDTQDVTNKITGRTKGIIPVHMAGYPCKMDEIIEICNMRELILIEDCAHALGTLFSSSHVGNYGIAGNFSFYPTKQITTGEGGMVITSDESVYRYIKTHKAFGIDTPPELRKKPGVYDVKGLGLNYRMTDFQAALGVGQLERYGNNLKGRQKNARLYEKYLEGFKGLNFQSYSDDSSYFLFQIILDDRFDRDGLLFKLKEAGIGVSIHYATPVPLMSYYKNKYGYNEDDFPNACFYGNQSLSLPVHPNLNEDDIEYVCKNIIEYLRGSES